MSLAVFTLLSTTVQYHSADLLEQMFQMIYSNVFPSTKKNPAASASMVPYNTCVTFLSMLSPSIRQILSKGKKVTQIFIKLIWSLLSIDNVLNDANQVTFFVLNSSKREVTDTLVRSNVKLCDVLSRTLKRSSISNGIGEKYRKAYTANLIQIIFHKERQITNDGK